MAVLVGLDLVDVTSVADALQAHGDRYLHRIYTAIERDECGRSVRRLAARFAVKEATMKLLDAEPLAWASIEVLKDPDTGQDSDLRVRLHGRARDVAQRQGIDRLSVSVAATPARATAIVIGEKTA